MTASEDNLPNKYPYMWTVDGGVPLDDFLTKYKPSMVQNDGTKPWIWVQGARSPPNADENIDTSLEEASEFLREVTDKIEKVKNDASIPTRSNKKTGAKSKKEIREQLQSEASEKLKEISVRHGHVSGKWLIFAPTDKVDQIWSRLANSLVSGPLASTSAFLAKVATCPQDESPNYQHVICLYMPDVYDKDAVTKVMRILLRNHGLNLSGVKTNLYTSIGIDSKHASGIPSTVWKNTTLLKDSEIKELKDAFYKELKDDNGGASTSIMTVTSENAPADGSLPEAQTKSKAKPKLQLKKKVQDDPFASDDEGGGGSEEEKRKEEVKAKVGAPEGKVNKRAKRKPSADEDDGEGEEEEEEEEEKPKKKKRGGAK